MGKNSAIPGKVGALGNWAWWCPSWIGWLSHPARKPLSPGLGYACPVVLYRTAKKFDHVHHLPGYVHHLPDYVHHLLYYVHNLPTMAIPPRPWPSPPWPIGDDDIVLIDGYVLFGDDGDLLGDGGDLLDDGFFKASIKSTYFCKNKYLLLQK